MSRKLAAQGKEGEVALQHCDACGVAIYPPREICPNCLSGDISWRAFDGTGDGEGEVLASSILSHSFDPAFAAKLPLMIVSVKLDLGPVVIAYAESEDICAGDRISLALDESQSALVALKIEGGERA